MPRSGDRIGAILPPGGTTNGKQRRARSCPPREAGEGLGARRRSGRVLEFDAAWRARCASNDPPVGPSWLRASGRLSGRIAAPRPACMRRGLEWLKTRPDSARNEAESVSHHLRGASPFARARMREPALPADRHGRRALGDAPWPAVDALCPVQRLGEGSRRARDAPWPRRRAVARRRRAMPRPAPGGDPRQGRPGPRSRPTT